jgi:hypothetical protein
MFVDDVGAEPRDTVSALPLGGNMKGAVITALEKGGANRWCFGT